MRSSLFLLLPLMLLGCSRGSDGPSHDCAPTYAPYDVDGTFVSSATQHMTDSGGADETAEFHDVGITIDQRGNALNLWGVVACVVSGGGYSVGSGTRTVNFVGFDITTYFSGSGDRWSADVTVDGEARDADGVLFYTWQTVWTLMLGAEMWGDEPSSSHLDGPRPNFLREEPPNPELVGWIDRPGEDLPDVEYATVQPHLWEARNRLP